MVSSSAQAMTCLCCENVLDEFVGQTLITRHSSRTTARSTDFVRSGFSYTFLRVRNYNNLKNMDNFNYWSLKNVCRDIHAYSDRASPRKKDAQMSLCSSKRYNIRSLDVRENFVLVSLVLKAHAFVEGDSRIFSLSFSFSLGTLCYL